MNKKILAGIFACFMAFGATACDGGGTTSNGTSGGNEPGGESSSVVDGFVDPAGPENVTYDTYGSFWMRQHDYKTMPISAFNALPHGNLTGFTYDYIGNEDTFKAYKEANVNTMFGLYEYAGSEEVAQALDWCSDYGLSYVLPLGGADSLTSASVVKSTLSTVKYHDAFGGIMQCDEPGYVNFEKIKKSAGILDSVMPEDMEGELWHVNLFPNYANQKQLYYRQYTSDTPAPEGGYTYQQYVDDYMSICQPKVLSYDFYPCNGDEGNLANTYFQNMVIIRDAAMKANVPFWVYIQTCKFSNGTRVPNQADIYWQVNTALSYGAKGIQYFTGVLPVDSHEIFTGAMFDRNGNRTDVYEYVKNANAQIAACDEVLMCAKSKGVILAGKNNIGGADTYIPEDDRMTTYGKLKSVEADHAIVGVFDYNGYTALYITNNSGLEADTVKLNLDTNMGYYVQKTVKSDITSDTVTLELEAGEGVLVVLPA